MDTCLTFVSSLQVFLYILNSILEGLTALGEYNTCATSVDARIFIASRARSHECFCPERKPSRDELISAPGNFLVAIWGGGWGVGGGGGGDELVLTCYHPSSKQ